MRMKTGDPGTSEIPPQAVPLVTPVISAPPPFSQPGACASFRQGVHGQCSKEHETRMLSFVVLISKAETQNISDLGEYTHACSVSEREGQGLPGN